MKELYILDIDPKIGNIEEVCERNKFNFTKKNIPEIFVKNGELVTDNFPLASYVNKGKTVTIQTMGLALC